MCDLREVLGNKGAPGERHSRRKGPEVGMSWPRGPIHEDLSPEQGGEVSGGSAGGEQGCWGAGTPGRTVL